MTFNVILGTKTVERLPDGRIGARFARPKSEASPTSESTEVLLTTLAIHFKLMDFEMELKQCYIIGSACAAFPWNTADTIACMGQYHFLPSIRF